MEHIYENIEGWFSFPELYKKVVEFANDGYHFVEVGTWLGRSASFLAVEIENSNKKIKFDCVDTWKGSEEHKDYEIILKDELYNTFLKNIEPVKHIINPIRMPSAEASKLYEDNSLDFVFLDAAHDYENVKLDIESWYPKVKNGGIFAGHDYGKDWPGVINAVHEFLSKKSYNGLDIMDESCWGVVKKES
jgi:Methyltransferase domain